MIKLNAGNVLLKPSHRRQLMAWLKRAIKLGQQVGDFVLKLSLHRAGKLYEVRADVHDMAGDFACRRRHREWRDAVREVITALTSRIHAQRVAVRV